MNEPGFIPSSFLNVLNEVTISIRLLTSLCDLSLFCLKLVFKIPFSRRLISSIYCINNKKKHRN